MSINDITESLYRINKQKNLENQGKFYIYKSYTDITKGIFDQCKAPGVKLISLDVAQVSPKDEPLIKLAHDVAKILYQKKDSHAAIASQITALEKMRDKRSIEGNEDLAEYCKILIDECISSLQKIDQSEITKKMSKLKLEKLANKEPSELTEEQYKQLKEKGAQLDKFFSSFEKFLSKPKEGKKFYEEFTHVWTLSLNKCFSNPKRERESRIAALEQSTKNLPEALVADTEIFHATKANLNFMLAVAILAKEMKRSSPNLSEIATAQNLLTQSAQFSEPAKIASQFNFNDWKNFSYSSEEMQKSYKEMKSAIKNAGCEEFISKRDLKEVFKRLSPEAVTKAKAIHILKTIAAILALPIAWSVSLALALAALILLIATYPIWSILKD